MKRQEIFQVRGTADAESVKAVSQPVGELTYREQEGFPSDVIA